MYGVIELFYKFKKYQGFTRKELFDYLIPIFNSGQFKIFYDNNEIVGFVSWAFLDEHTEDIFRKTGRLLRYNCGNNLWLIDILSTRNVKHKTRWIKKYFTKILGNKKKMNYLRVNNNNKITTIKHQLTQEHYKWVV